MAGEPKFSIYAYGSKYVVVRGWHGKEVLFLGDSLAEAKAFIASQP